MDHSVIDASRRAVASEYLGQLINLNQNHGAVLLEVARLLKIFRDERLYQDLGEGGNDNFRQFIAGAEVGIAPSTAYHYIRIYEVFCLELKYTQEDLSGIHINRLQKLTSIVKTREQADDWLNKARVLGNGDFFDEVATIKGNSGKNILPYPKIRRCEKCALWRVEAEAGTMCNC